MLRRSITVLGLALSLTACGGAATTPQTVDNVGPTQTRAAELTQVAAALAPTATAAATNTPAATATLPAPKATAIPPTATTIPATPTTRPPTSTPRPPSPTVAPTPATLPKVGGTAQGKGYSLVLHALVDPAPVQQYSKPKEGFRWVSFDVTVTNTGTAPLDYNPFYFKAKAADNREYTVTFSGTPPLLGTGKQQPGEAARGWVTVEVPADAALATLVYDPAFGANRVQFDLR